MKRARLPLVVTFAGLLLSILAVIALAVAGIPHFVEMADLIGSGHKVDPNQLSHVAGNTLSPVAFVAACIGILGMFLFSAGCIWLVILGIASLTGRRAGSSA